MVRLGRWLRWVGMSLRGQELVTLLGDAVGALAEVDSAVMLSSDPQDVVARWYRLPACAARMAMYASAPLLGKWPNPRSASVHRNIFAMTILECQRSFYVRAWHASTRLAIGNLCLFCECLWLLGLW